jgi:hypothetical protein
MRKMKLDVERLDVETFEAGPGEDDRGTVIGQYSQIGTCGYPARLATCQLNGTCANTCGSRCTDRCL